jgi:hypothetical protein
MGAYLLNWWMKRMIAIYPLDAQGHHSQQALAPAPAAAPSHYYVRLALLLLVIGGICGLLMSGLLSFPWVYFWFIGGDLMELWFVVLVILAILYLRTFSRMQENNEQRWAAQSIESFVLAVSTDQPVVGQEFVVRHTLNCKQTTSIQQIGLSLKARISTGKDDDGADVYQTETVLSHTTPSAIGYVTAPVADEFRWCVPATNTYLHSQIAEWFIEALIQQGDGTKVTGRYPFTLVNPGPLAHGMKEAF